MKSRKLNSFSETWMVSNSSSSNSAASSSSSTTCSGGDDPEMNKTNFKCYSDAVIQRVREVYINKKCTWEVGMQDLLKEFQFLFSFHIS